MLIKIYYLFIKHGQLAYPPQVRGGYFANDTNNLKEREGGRWR